LLQIKDKHRKSTFMPYKTQSMDTDERIERMQFVRLRSMGQNERYARGLSLVDEGLNALWKSLEHNHPNWTRPQLLVEWTRIHYGEELANRYAEYLKCRSNITKSALQ